MTLNSTAQLLEKPLFHNVPRQIQKNTEKPLLIVGNGFPVETSDTRPRERGIETAPTIIKREKKPKLCAQARLTDVERQKSSAKS